MEVITFLRTYENAKSKRELWEQHWQECYDFVMPTKANFTSTKTPGSKNEDKLFDATATDAVENLTSNLLANLTPAWGKWFALSAGNLLSGVERESATAVLARDCDIIQSNFDRSNFIVEIHQCYLDLIIGGTACLLFEEAAIGELSAFKFTAVPLHQIVLEEGASGKLNKTYREYQLTYNQIKARFPSAQIPKDLIEQSANDDTIKFKIVEAVLPYENAFLYKAVLKDFEAELKEVKMDYSPYINFRWMKSAGEIYGRSPIMKILPDIKTANKVVELILKNASIAATGVWQADDDGILNPATVKLCPGAIIPKAVGSAGLTPLSMPGNFDVSQIVLTDLRDRIKHGLWSDKLGAVGQRQMTATEVLERSAEMSQILSATFARLQSELLTPLILRAMSILKRRGEISELNVDGKYVYLEYTSPLANSQAQMDVKNVLYWIQSANAIGTQGQLAINILETAKWLGKKLGVPDKLINEQIGTPEIPIEAVV